MWDFKNIKIIPLSKEAPIKLAPVVYTYVWGVKTMGSLLFGEDKRQTIGYWNGGTMGLMTFDKGLPWNTMVYWMEVCDSGLYQD